MRLLVTGAGGFIGRALCERLMADGHHLCALLRPSSATAPPRASEVARVNLVETGTLRRALAHPPDAVVHLAAVLPPALEGDAAKVAAAQNRRMDEEVFSACLAWRSPVIYFSGTVLYDAQDPLLKTEDSPVAPCGPYATEKMEGEEIGSRLMGEEQVGFAALRVSAPYGPGQRARTVLQRFVDCALRGDPLVYWGDGDREQDFTHVTDIVGAVASALSKQARGIFNVASGRPINMHSLASLVVSCIPGTGSVVRSSGRADPQEGATAFFSIEKAKCELGWAPCVTLDAGIRELAHQRKCVPL